MKKLIRTAGALVALAFSASALAVPVTFTWTADNDFVAGGVCVNAGCPDPFNVAGLSPLFSFGAEANAEDWTTADSHTLNLAPGTYDILFIARQDGTFSSSNPAGLLAEISWDSNSNVSSDAWQVWDGFAWGSSTEWGANDGTAYWSQVAGISSSAQWIWDVMNFSEGSEGGSPQLAFMTSIQVPEPGTLALLGLGLIGVGMTRRKKMI